MEKKDNVIPKTNKFSAFAMMKLLNDDRIFIFG